MPRDVMEFDVTQMKNLFEKLDSTSKPRVLKRSLDQSGKFLAGWIKSNRLTGPRPTFLGVITGRLRSSISSTKPTKTKLGYQIKIGTNVEYAPKHEFGSKFVRERPFLRPSIESRANQIKIISIFTKNINLELAKK